MKTGRRIRRMQNLKRQIRRWFQVYEFSSVEDDHCEFGGQRPSAICEWEFIMIIMIIYG